MSRTTAAAPTIDVHADDGRGQPRPVLVWRWSEPVVAVSSAALGGGERAIRWVVNAEVDRRYDRPDPTAHLRCIAQDLGLDPDAGAGLLTAAPVRAVATALDHDVRCDATVGLHPLGWAAADGSRTPPDSDQPTPGTINLVCAFPVAMTAAALVNAVITAAEAKSQALFEAGISATGTATDAVVVVAPRHGEVHEYGGPRSRWGARLARAAHQAVAAGIRRDGAAASTRRTSTDP